MGIGLARKLRKTNTLPEVKLWQYPIGPYVVDFVCLEQKLVIELDGGQHADQLIYDNKRTEYLEHFGFRVVRFWNHDVFAQFELVLEQVRLSIKI